MKKPTDNKSKTNRSVANVFHKKRKSQTKNIADEPQEEIMSLHYAAYSGNIMAVQDWIDKGYEVNHYDETGYTARQWAACEEHKEVVES